MIKHGLKDMEAYELLYPVLFNYRHAIELYLKALVKPQKRSHDLGDLLNDLENLSTNHHATKMPKWFGNLIKEFIQYDPRATTFRYPGKTNASEELIVELPQLQHQMDILSQVFHRIYLAEIDYEKKLMKFKGFIPKLIV